MFCVGIVSLIEVKAKVVNRPRSELWPLLRQNETCHFNTLDQPPKKKEAWCAGAVCRHFSNCSNTFSKCSRRALYTTMNGVSSSFGRALVQRSRVAGSIKYIYAAQSSKLDRKPVFVSIYARMMYLLLTCNTRPIQ